MEKVKGNYNLQFEDGLSSYLCLATDILRPEQISGNATENLAFFGIRTKNRSRQTLSNCIQCSMLQHITMFK